MADDLWSLTTIDITKSMEKGVSLQLQGRKRKSHTRRSSILKPSKSPSREALADLDPNAQQDGSELTQDVKTQRRSRRVSFAETFTVKEFHKEVTFTTVPSQDPAKIPNVEPDDLTNLYKKPDSSSSLNTLLNGPFLNNDPVAHGPVYQCPMPNVSDDSIQSNETHSTSQVAHAGLHHDTQQSSTINESMEFTKCVGQVYIPPRQFDQTNLSWGPYDLNNRGDSITFNNTSINKFVGRHTFDSNKTQIFNDDSCNMELTACIDGSNKDASNLSGTVATDRIDTADFLSKLSSKPKMTVKPQPRPGSMGALFGVDDEEYCENENGNEFKLNIGPDFGCTQIDSSSFLKRLQSGGRQASAASLGVEDDAPLHTTGPLMSSAADVTKRFDENGMELTACQTDVMLATNRTNCSESTKMLLEGFSRLSQSQPDGADDTDKLLAPVSVSVNQTRRFDGDTMDFTVCQDAPIAVEENSGLMNTQNLLKGLSGAIGDRSRFIERSMDTEKLLAGATFCWRSANNTGVEKMMNASLLGPAKGKCGERSALASASSSQQFAETLNCLKGLSSGEVPSKPSQLFQAISDHKSTKQPVPALSVESKADNCHDDSMEFTFSGGQIVDNDTLIPFRAESTRRLDVDLKGGEMDFTKCIGTVEGINGSFVEGRKEPNLLVGKVATVCEPQNTLSTEIIRPSVKPTLTNEEETKVFNANDADMEFTECIGGDPVAPPGGQNGDVVDESDHSAVNSKANKTCLFGSDGMELTTCVGNLSVGSVNGPQSFSKPDLVQHSGANLTASLVDLTNCGGNGHVDSIGNKHNFSKSEVTQHFGAEMAGGMELTASVGDISVNNIGHQQNIPKPEPTQHFEADLSDRGMELTTCVGNVLVDNVSHLLNITKPEPTQHFGPEVTAGAMELTTCVGNISVDNVGSQQNTSKPEPTQHFETEMTAGGMELTTCVGNISVDNVGSQQNTSKPEPTQHFETEMTAGGMELTTCVGNISVDNVGSQQNTSKPEPTQHFETEMTAGGMELTTCVGNISVDNVGSQQNTSKPEPTQHFETEMTAGGMELTTCVGDISVVDVDSQQNISKSERTQHFGTESTTGGMEFTTCVGNISVNNVGSRLDTSKRELTQRFGTEMTANGMELTACVGDISMVNTDSKPCIPNSKSTQPCRTKLMTPGEMDLATGVSNITVNSSRLNISKTEQTQYFGGELTAGGMELTACCVGNISVNSISNERSPSKPVAAQPSGIDVTRVGEAGQSDKLPTLSFVQKPVVEAKILPNDVSSQNDGAFLEPVATEDVVQPCDKNTPHRLDEPGQTFADVRTEGGCLKGDGEMDLLDEIEPPSLEISFNQPSVFTDMHNTKSASTASSHSKSVLSQSTGDVSLHATLSGKSMLSQSAGDASLPATSHNKSMLSQSLHEKSLMTTSAEGLWSCSDFLEYIRISFAVPNVTRRSTIAPVSMAPPESLGEFLDLVCIVQPELKQHEWACDYLSTEIERLKEEIVAAENRISAKNPEIIKKVKTYGDIQLKEFETEARLLLQNCMKMSKNMYKEWQTKFLKTILEAYQEEEECLGKSIKQLDTVNERMSYCISQVDEVEAQMDKETSELESLLASLSRDIGELSRTTEQLAVKENELQAVQTEKANLQRESDDIASENDHLFTELKDLEYHLVDCSDDAAQAEALGKNCEKLERLQSYVPWQLEEFCDQHAKFSFMFGSLVLEVQFSGIGDSGVSESRDRVCLLSKLPDQAGPLAHHAHKMVLGSLDQANLSVVYTCLDDLPQLLARLSKITDDALTLAGELERVDLRHSVQTNETCVTVGFSHLEAFSKFHITFPLQPGRYPAERLQCSCAVKIGELSESAILDAVSGVEPGPFYLQRMVSAVDELLENYSKENKDC